MRLSFGHPLRKLVGWTVYLYALLRLARNRTRSRPADRPGGLALLRTPRGPRGLPPLRRVDGETTLRVDVVVSTKTRKVRPLLPGGTIDAFDVLLELQAIDEKMAQTSSSAARKTYGSKGPLGKS